MPYYDTLDDDLQRARAILADGQPDPASLTALPASIRSLAGGTIYGKDIAAAYQLLQAFVAEIERLQADAAARCPLYQPDHNGECVDCDEWADAHTPEALARGEALAARLAEAHAPLRQEIAALRADAERERAARAVVDEALRAALAERDHARALVEAVGHDVCELALRQQRRAASGPTGAAALRADLSQPDD